MRKTCGFLAIIVGLLMAAPAAQAAPVTFQFSFTVDETQGAMDDLFGGPINVGDVLNGYLTYDTAGAVDGYPDDSTAGYYDFASGATLGLLTPRPLITDEYLFVDLANDDGGEDRFQAWSYAPINANGFDIGFFQLAIIDHTGGWLSSDALPSTFSLEQLAALNTGVIFQASRNDERHYIAGHLTYDGPGDPGTPPPAVPEPASLTLLGTGLLGLVRLRRRRLGADA